MRESSTGAVAFSEWGRNSVRVLFLHGWYSVVGGLKPTYLRDQGYQVFNPALDDDDFELAQRTAQREHDEKHPDIIVGSSRGGAIAMNLQSGPTPLLLLCPAWRSWGRASTVNHQTRILHSRNDEVIPFVDSQALIANSGLPPEALIEVGSDHRLADPAALAAMRRQLEALVNGQR